MLSMNPLSYVNWLWIGLLLFLAWGVPSLVRGMVGGVRRGRITVLRRTIVRNEQPRKFWSVFAVFALGLICQVITILFLVGKIEESRGHPLWR